MLQPSTITFLRQLKRHNEKAWFDANKGKYLDAKADFENFIRQIISEFGKIDPDISTLQVKDCVFRIYRDTRFSKNKTPYKTHFAAGINKGGKRVHVPGYYFHAELGDHTYCGGGIWRPDMPELKKIRQEIDYNYEDFSSIIKDKKFVKIFGDLDDEDALSRAPQGYEEDNPAIKYLKMRSFITGVSFPDEELSSKELLKKIVHTFTVMKPFINFLSRALE